MKCGVFPPAGATMATCAGGDGAPTAAGGVFPPAGATMAACSGDGGATAAGGGAAEALGVIGSGAVCTVAGRLGWTSGASAVTDCWAGGASAVGDC